MNKFFKKCLVALSVCVCGLSSTLSAAEFVSKAPFVAEEQKSPEFFVFIPSYDNEKYCKRNLEALFTQTYTNWVAYYVDDCSSDKTGALVEEYVKARGFQDKVTIVHNPVRKRAMANYVDAIAHSPKHKVVISYDGDDFFKHKDVLKNLAEVYSNPNVWMTYGTYCCEPEDHSCVCQKLPRKVVKHRRFRKYHWVTSQLRTFYAKLFFKIRPDDLKYQGKDAVYKSYVGQYVPSACDLAMMFPMLEMASGGSTKKSPLGHIHYVKEVNYIYNRMNVISDCIVNREMQAKMDHYVRAKSKYKPLKRLFSKKKKSSAMSKKIAQ